MSKIIFARVLLRNNTFINTNNIKSFHQKICSNSIINYSTDHVFQQPQRLLHTKSLGKVKLQPNLYADDPDTFGALSGDSRLLDNRPEDPGDLQEEEFISNPLPSSQQISTVEYADMIKNHLKFKRIKEAVDVLQIKVLKEDRLKPVSKVYIYNLVISGCARIGYTKMAFKLYNDMKRRKIEPSQATYTSLFVSCSNAPWQHDGLERATALRNKMKEKAIEPNLTNYNAMIKAFGRCGDIVTAFEIVDEMLSKKIKIRVHTINFLLQACISDKKTGFKHALLTWRKMLQKREKPNIYTFNLMLKCANDCEMGEEPFDLETFLSITPSRPKALSHSIKNECKHIDLIGDTEINNKNNLQDNQISKLIANSPNLLSLNPSFDNVLSLNNPKSPEERFCMMGGLEGFLREVNLYKVKPNIKMMTQILTVLPSDLDSENKLISLIDNLKIKYDIDFFNMLIKKRCLRFDYDAALTVRTLIDAADKKERKKRYYKHKAAIKPDIITYGVLAMCCDSKNKAQDLVNEMTEKHLRINAEIIGTLFRHATSKSDFDYIDFVIEKIEEQDIQVNDIFLKHLLQFKNKCKSFIKNVDIQNDIQENSKKFVEKSNTLYKKLNHNKENAPINPWVQFKENMNESFQRNPNMQPKKRYSYKHRRLAPRYVVKV